MQQLLNTQRNVFLPLCLAPREPNFKYDAQERAKVLENFLAGRVDLVRDNAAFKVALPAKLPAPLRRCLRQY